MEGAPEDRARPKEPDSMETRRSVMQLLALEYTRNSLQENQASSAAESPFGSNDPDSPLNPHSEKFSARAWARNVARAAKETGHGFRKVGLCFQNLNVFGYGTPTDFQKDVANVWLALPSTVRRIFCSTAGQTRIDILRHFDGLIRPGEMCVVLGPPGSGCSTLLKSISGDTDGIYVEKDSYFNYHGLSAQEMHRHHRGDAIYTAEIDVHFPMLTVGETLTFAARARCPRDLPHGIARDQYASSDSFDCFLTSAYLITFQGTPIISEMSSWLFTELVTPSTPRWETTLFEACPAVSARESRLPKLPFPTPPSNAGTSAFPSVSLPLRSDLAHTHQLYPWP